MNNIKQLIDLYEQGGVTPLSRSASEETEIAIKVIHNLTLEISDLKRQVFDLEAEVKRLRVALAGLYSACLHEVHGMSEYGNYPVEMQKAREALRGTYQDKEEK